MFSQFISQLEDQLDLHGFPPPIPTVPPSYSVNSQSPTIILAPPLPSPSQLFRHRWCFLNVENSSSEDDCYDLLKPQVLEVPLRKIKRERKQSDTSGSNESMEEIWKSFPEDLHEEVISRLPIPTFFRFRSVCHNWNSLLKSSSFTRQYAHILSSQPWFYTFTYENNNSGAMFDPISRKWHYPVAPKISTKVIILPVASAGGLVCCLDIPHRSFYVFNPLTNSVKELPARSAKIWSRAAVGMITNNNSDHEAYNIMWVGCNGEYGVYDSIKNNWTHVGDMPDCIKVPFSLNLSFRIVAIDRLMYFLRSNPDGVVSFDMDFKVWKQYLVPAPPDSRDHALAECRGNIVLVGLVTKNAATCVSIWELQKMTLLWKEVDRMPNEMCLEFYGKHVKLSCLGNKGLLMLSLESKMTNQLITYDITKKEWLMVPAYVPPHSRKQMWVASGTSFYPSLTAMA